MKRQLTHIEAWANFWSWVTVPENWATVDRTGRDRIKKAHKRYLFKKPADLGYEGVKTLLERYAPGRYTFSEIVTINEI